MTTRQHEIEITKITIAECREQIKQYEIHDYERQSLSDEISELVEELNKLEEMTDEEYDKEHREGE